MSTKQRTNFPPAIKEMRASTSLLLGPDGVPDVLPPTADELVTLTETLREHIQLLIPEVAKAAARQPKDSVPRYCALACIGEAHNKLHLGDDDALPVRVSVARKLARVVNALCDHWENLVGATHPDG
ncbi:DUF6415 family natural product biosynthesis protein [Streptomyces sp. WI04-05B]|uniref:DUF6415 family natural product biosynthesis protein n=1 Tax=Streptomyces TaxID=1883 RepID=UPI0029A6314E|nr:MULTISPECIES: DUF6415 family natural product biosynthesis protein [unclassified Streptomyces]MDX2547172.1 DUF6415 family natural product biosynthesis protein [Streptomyces sp. WI04-05B]MDX2581994.1 DUF6415 family natural product biosynthesis protein [Streptomyces sp. WI04-05A]